MPQVLLDLGEHLHDPNPIQVSQIIVIPVLVLSGSYVASCQCRVYKVNHVIGVWLASQSASEKHNQEKKPTNLCALGEFLKKMSAMFDDHTISLFSRVLAAWSAFRALFTWSWLTTRAKDHRLFYLDYPQISEVGKSDHVVRMWNALPRNKPWGYDGRIGGLYRMLCLGTSSNPIGYNRTHDNWVTWSTNRCVSLWSVDLIRNSHWIAGHSSW